MLVLQRVAGQRIWIGSEVCIVALKVKGGKVKLGIEAAKGIKVLREEVFVNRLNQVRVAVLIALVAISLLLC
jgi:carbon storage regulator CsrA